uniref:glucuronosyltransferase n=1 Tax=Meloidogyne javanica TaxID=6303 RepID=A0A915N519_MELJA
MPKIEDLLRKSKYYLINVHPLGRYFVRENEENDQVCSEKIVYIGGIEVEIEGKIKQKTNFEKIKGKAVYLKNKIKNSFKGKNRQIETINVEVNDNVDEMKKFIDTWIKKAKCLVIFNMGTAVGYEAYTNVVCYITDGGQKSFNEALYAGVPLLVIPSFGEQYFNATLTKYMQIGITMNYEKFVDEFLEKFKEIMKQVYFLAKYFILLIFKRDRDLKGYSENAQNIAKAIHSSPYTQIDKFLKTVEKAINDENEEPFPSISTDNPLQFYSNELEIHSKFSLDVPNFCNPL